MARKILRKKIDRVRKISDRHKIISNITKNISKDIVTSSFIEDALFTLCVLSKRTREIKKKILHIYYMI